MNCKQGDMAFVVRSIAGNEGKVVTCLYLVDKSEVETNRLCREDSPWWRVDRELNFFDIRLNQPSTPKYYAPDCNLRPIRDTGDEDEMLRIAGLPKIKEDMVI